MITGCLIEGGCLIGDRLVEGQRQFHIGGIGITYLTFLCRQGIFYFYWGIDSSHSVFFFLALHSNLASVFDYIFTA